MAKASTIRGLSLSFGSCDDIAAMALIRHGKASCHQHPASLCVLDDNHHHSVSLRASFSNRSEWPSAKKLCTELSLVGGSSNSKSTSLHRRKKSGNSMAFGCRCLGEGAWFELPSESSSTNAKTSRVGDFKILSHLQQLGGGELTKKPQEVYFPGCLNESYAFHCTGGDYFVKINRRFDVDSRFAGEFEANCEQRRRRYSHSFWEDSASQDRFNSSICNFYRHGEQFCKGRVRAQHAGFERKDGALGSRIRGESLRNPLSVATREEELIELIFRREATADRRRKGFRSFTLYASLDPYETLGVPTTATVKEIKQAYRRLALKLHPDVNKEPDAQQKFLRIKSAYQTLSDEKSRAKHNASRRGSPSWDPFSWDSERKSAQKSQEEEFYGFGEFFKDVSVSIEEFFRDLQADNRRQPSKPKSLWEELADIGEEFVEFLEKELNINDTTAKEEKASGYEARNENTRSESRDAKKKAEGAAQNAQRDAEAEKDKVQTEIAEIEDMLAQLKKELGI